MNWLRVEQHVYEHRLSRMKAMIEAKAPPIVIYTEAKYILAAWHPPLLERVKGWLLKIVWRFRLLVSSGFRQRLATRAEIKAMGKK